ncbi:MAG: diphthine--ammonia ligase [Candidatus Pacearchaeota archaeon]|nr:diphthine--ammonia ligase [Candidatus Pacearchaeota archaeon]
MKAAVLFSGGKDSCYSLYLAKKKGYDIACLISIFSKNKESYMFHTPSISQVGHQANVMRIQLITKETEGVKEKELEDLTEVIKQVKEKYEIDTLVTGAIRSDYQLSRIKRICDNLGLQCFNPLWQKNEVEYLQELIDNKFKVIITGVFAFPLDKSWLGRVINDKFIKEAKILNEKYKIHIAGEGGEFETFVVDCPLFKKPLKIKNKKIFGEKNSWRMEVEIG